MHWMKDEGFLGEFESSEKPEVMGLFDGYTEAYDVFTDDLYDRIQEYWEYIDEGNAITINEYDEIVEALRIGQRALRIGGKLETMNPTEAFLKQRGILADMVYQILNLKREFDENPRMIDFNPEKYDYMGGTDRGF